MEHFKDTFLDLISGGLDDRFGYSTSKSPAARLPEEIRLKLASLTGLCTYTLLDDLRFGACEAIEWDADNLAGTVGDWFGRLRQTTSEWSYTPPDRDKTTMANLAREGMLSSQWTHMGEELLALDKAIRVPRDAPAIRRIFDAIKCIPAYVVKKINAKYPQMKMSVQPMGSYPANAKVIDVDEFDFLVVCDMEQCPRSEIMLWWSRMKNDFPAIMVDSLRPNGDATHGGISGKLRYRHDNHPRTSEPYICRTYGHGPAQCVEIRWDCLPESSGCRESHQHTISIDVTFSYTSPVETLKSHVSDLQGKPIFAEVYQSIDDAEKAVNLPGDQTVTTSVLDRTICQELEKFSPNILVVYRLAKVLAQYMLPSISDQAPNSSMPSNMSPLVDSHTLKHLLYSCVEANPVLGHWKTDQLPHRLIDLLQRVKVKQGPRFIKINEQIKFSLYFKDVLNRGMTVRTLGEQQNNLDSLMVLLLTAYESPRETNELEPGYLDTRDRKTQTHGLNTNDLETNVLETNGLQTNDLQTNDLQTNDLQTNDLQTHSIDSQANLSNAASHKYTYPEHHHIPRRTYFPERITMLMLTRGIMHPLSDDREKLQMVSDAKGTALFYKLKSDAKMMFQTHPLITWCHEFIHDLYVHNPGPDISTVEWLDFSHIWTLYRAEILSPQDMESGVMRDAKIHEFMKLLTIFGQGLVFDRFAMGSIGMGRDLYFVMEEYVSFNQTVPGFFDDYILILDVIPKILPNLDLNERAFIQKWCILAIDHNDPLFGCDSLLHMKSLDSENLFTILRCLEVTYITIERFGEGGLNSNFLHSHVLFLHVMRHVWFHDRGYLASLRPEHFTWAEQRMKTIKLNEKLQLPSTIEDSPLNSERISRDIGECRVVRVEKGTGAIVVGAGSFYRCLAVCWNRSCLWQLRSRGGSHLVTPVEVRENGSAQIIRRTVTQVLLSEQEQLNNLLFSGKIQEREHQGNKNHRVSLTDNPTSGWCIEMLAAVHAIQTQIKIYEHIGDKYVHTLSIPPAPLGDGPPLCLLYENYINDKPEYGHYSLIVRNSTPLPDFKLPFQRPDTEENTGCFTGVLADWAARFEVTPWRALPLYQDENALYACVALHLLADAQETERTEEGRVEDAELEETLERWSRAVRAAVHSLYTQERACLEKLTGDREWLLQRGLPGDIRPPYSSLAERVAAVSDGAPAGMLELAAVSYLAQTQVHLYLYQPASEMCENHITIPAHRHHDDPPISLTIAPVDGYDVTHRFYLMTEYAMSGTGDAERDPSVDVLEKNILTHGNISELHNSYGCFADYIGK